MPFGNYGGVGLGPGVGAGPITGIGAGAGTAARFRRIRRKTPDSIATAATPSMISAVGEVRIPNRLVEVGTSSNRTF